MKTFRTAAVVVAVVILPTLARAGLGETLEQSIAHYGPVVSKSQNDKVPVRGELAILYEFSKNGFHIQERFLNGKCVWMLYLKDDTPIFESEIRSLLENNAEGSTWSTGTEEHERFIKKKVSYERVDHLANAEYKEMGNYHGLIILTKAWRDAASAAAGL